MTAPKLKVVFDSNVYIAAALNPAGSSDAWLRIAGRQMRSFDLYTSISILDETSEKLLEKFNVNPAKVKVFIESIRDVATIVTPKERVRVVDKDPDDDMLFECALAAQANLLVSADKEVLRASPYRGIGVCSPSDLKNIFAQDLKYI